MALCQRDCALGYGGLSASRPLLHAVVSSSSDCATQALPNAIYKTAGNDNVAACHLRVFYGPLGKSTCTHL